MEVVNISQNDLSLLDRSDRVHTGSYVAGQWRQNNTGQTAVLNPATESVLGNILNASPTVVRDAVTSAHEALSAWRYSGIGLRQRCLDDWADLIYSARKDLAQLMVLEQGKPIAEAFGEVDYALEFLRFYAKWRPDSSYQSASHLPGATQRIQRNPLGVVALVTPWNFPMAMLIRKAAAALVAGCTVVAHPSKETPFTAIYLAALAHEAQIPAGVINIVVGEPEPIVTEWMDDARIRGISFTGSTEIGRLLYRQGAKTMKRLMLELGGHAPVLVFPDAPLEATVEHIMQAKFATSGQDCLAANRVYIHDDCHDSYVEALVERVAKLSVGSGFDSVDVGPMIHRAAVEKIHQQVVNATELGATCRVGGTPHPAGSRFYTPTVLTGVNDQMAIAREETFGPVLPILRFSEESDVLSRANATEYGLIAYIHSLDRARIERLSNELDYGMVAVNRTKVTGAPIPFGGLKQSGLAREGGPWGYEAFTELKYVCFERGTIHAK